MFKMKKLLSVVLVMTMVMELGTTALAAENTNRAFMDIEDIAQSSILVEDSSKINDTIQLAKNVIESDEILLNHEKAYLDYEDASILDVFIESNTYTSITIPVTGQNYSLISNITLLFDNNDIISYSESLITTSDDGKFVVSNYLNGVLVSTEKTDFDAVSNDEIEDSINRLQNLSLTNRSATAGCLAGILGVDIVIAAIIAKTCVAACAATATGVAAPVCVACIAGVVTLGGANIAGIVACFSI